jgi:hypothetical protein
LTDIYEKLIAPHEDTFGQFEAWELSKICRYKNYAHFGPAYLLLLKYNRPPCSFTLIPQAYYPGMYTIPTMKKSAYHGILNFK